MTHPDIDQHITFLATNDLGKTAQFFESVLGLTLKLDQGICRIYELAGGSYLGFCQRSEDEALPSTEPSPVIVTLVTENVDAWYDYLSRRGVHPDKPPALNSKYGIYHFFFRDPNGYLIEIQRFLEAF